MFENILHQENVVNRLAGDIASESLPPAILFSGTPMSGKLTTALELARVLSCERGGEWNCLCVHCRSHRELSHTRTLLVGARDLTAEIAAAAEVVRRDASDAPRFLVVRSARRLLRRFDPVLWDGEERKLDPVRPVMERLGETLETLLPGKPLPEGKKREDLLNTLMSDCAAVQRVLPATLPVAQVRHITAWACHSAGGDHKTVILDAADRMPEGSRNALLKFLEEPPPDTTAILITDRKSLLLPTIVSRLRDYGFRTRRMDQEAEVLRRVFREDEGRWNGLMEYFRAWKSGPSERMRGLAADFLDRAGSGNPDLPDGVDEIREPQDMTVFLEAVSDELRARWATSERPDHRRSARDVACLREARMRSETLNLPVQLVLKGLYLTLGSAS